LAGSEEITLHSYRPGRASKTAGCLDVTPSPPASVAREWHGLDGPTLGGMAFRDALVLGLPADAGATICPRRSMIHGIRWEILLPNFNTSSLQAARIVAGANARREISRY
jgi:hypothetical protein